MNNVENCNVVCLFCCNIFEDKVRHSRFSENASALKIVLGFVLFFVLGVLVLEHGCQETR
jgi:hypothetical protein